MLVRDICIVQSNNYQKKEKWNYFNYLDTGNLTRNHLQSFQFIKNEKDLPSRAKQKVELNDILYSSVRPIQEHYGFIDKICDNLLVSTGFIILKPLSNLVNPKYLFYYLTQKEIINQLQTIAQNSTSSYPSISKDDILNLQIDLPSLQSQEKIAFILTLLDQQIERNESIVKRLQVLGKTIYSKKTTNCLFDKMSLNVVITTGKEDANHARINGRYKFFTCGDNSLMCDDFKFEGKSVLVAGNGNFNVKYYDGKFNAYQRTYIIKNDKIIGNLYYTLLFNTELFRKKSNGSIIKFITIDMLNKIDIPIFSNEINSTLNAILSNINEIQNNTIQLQCLKNKLLPLLINQQLV